RQFQDLTPTFPRVRPSGLRPFTRPSPRCGEGKETYSEGSGFETGSKSRTERKQRTMKVAVTGAAGRIGRAVLEELKNDGGYEAWGLDRTLPPPGSARRSLLVDLSDAGQVYGALAGAEAVIHLGAYPSTANHPGELVYVNNTAACANVVAACVAF